MVLCVHQQISNHILSVLLFLYFFITLLSASVANKDYIYLYRSGRPIDSYKTIVSTDDDDGQ